MIKKWLPVLLIGWGIAEIVLAVQGVRMPIAAAAAMGGVCIAMGAATLCGGAKKR